VEISSRFDAPIDFLVGGPLQREQSSFTNINKCFKDNIDRYRKYVQTRVRDWHEGPN
jgi:hypothetical protein